MNFLKYYLIFNAIFYLGQIIIALVGYVLDINIGTGASMGAIVAGGIVAGRSFCIDHGRLPSSGEKWRLVIGSFLINVAVSVALTAAALVFVPTARLLAAEIVESVGLVPLGLIVVVVTAVYIGVMYFSFGFLLSKVMAKSLGDCERARE